jgi:hypothetical protein
MRFPLSANALALMLCAPVCVLAFEAPPAAPPDACAPFAESVAAEATAGGRDDAAAGPSMPVEAEAVKIRLKDAERTPLLEAAYKDARDALGQDEECSDFFGGRDGAQHVLDQLVGRLQDRPVRESNIAIRMQGDYTNITDYRTGAKYRLFDEAVVNSKGPFFREKDGPRAFPDCGGFAPNTRGARAAMLLHELGHLIRRADGRWVLPNDGNDFGLAARNAERVEQKCGRHLKALDARAGPGRAETVGARARLSGKMN